MTVLFDSLVAIAGYFTAMLSGSMVDRLLIGIQDRFDGELRWHG
jgi:hypothetical protein